ncbi:hypothetical protein LTR84_013070 [Exophiala bonariae]|uniref:ribonuclease Z n=1 Tax=Exophiala bonariae TaxID=1690606 RepID=A0AAV9NHD4_9EURO|nr:hypothetical protein LTR84_013070 [Exophiala bonariae]
MGLFFWLAQIQLSTEHLTQRHSFGIPNYNKSPPLVRFFHVATLKAFILPAASPFNVAVPSKLRLVPTPPLFTQSSPGRYSVRRGQRWNAGFWPLQRRSIHSEFPRLKVEASTPIQQFIPWGGTVSHKDSEGRKSRRAALLDKKIKAAKERRKILAEQLKSLKTAAYQAGSRYYKRELMEESRQTRPSIGIRSPFRLQFITTPTSDTPGTSLLLHFDQKRYIFGHLAEGTQRACIQRGVALKKVRGLFLTGKTAWSNGGLIGMILSLADAQSAEAELQNGSLRRPRLSIYAGPKQLHSLACARRFVFRTGMPLSVHEASVSDDTDVRQPILEDENIRVWAVPTQHRARAESATTVNEHSDVSDAEAESSLSDNPSDPAISLEQGIRNEVVNNMFDSDWHRDRLSEYRIKDITLPAVVWVRNPKTKELTSRILHDREKISPLTPESVVLVRDPWPASTVHELPKPTNLPSRTSMSYIVKGYPQRGKFDPVKAKALGVKPGPMYSRFTAGLSVTLEDGSVITSDMVMSPGRPGRGFAIFDVPSRGYLSDLSQRLHDYSDLLEGVELVVWITRDNVPLTPEFQNLRDYLKDKQHILSHPDVSNDYLSQESSARAAARLAQISPELFPLPRFNNEYAYSRVSDTPKRALKSLLEKSENDSPINGADRGLTVHIEPALRTDFGDVPINYDYSDLTAHQVRDEVRKLIPSDTLANIRETALVKLSEPEIITLGTGSAAPSKYRNVSAVLLCMPNDMGNYLFDCGEGTLGQLKRLFDASELDEVLYNLKVIWISHLHADHHLGTVSLLQAIYQAGQRQVLRGRPRPQPPLLISEVNMKDYIEEYKHILNVPEGSLCRSIVCHWDEGLSLHDKPFDFRETDIPIRTIETVRVNHCHGAQAISVTFNNDFKFSYSGDCRPSRQFCQIGADSDVLVHEATFDDGMEGDALAKKHSTTGEAVGVALEMKAKNLILTHFSQRYSKIPVLTSVKLPESTSQEADDIDYMGMDNGHNDTAPTGHELTHVSSQDDAKAWSEPSLTHELPIAIAFDLMRIRVSQIAMMKTLFPAISKMFELEEAKADAERQDRIADMVARGVYKVSGSGEKNSNGKNESSEGGARKKRKGKDNNGVAAEAGETTGLSQAIPKKNAKRAQAAEGGGADAAVVSISLGGTKRAVSPGVTKPDHSNTGDVEIENMTLSPGKRRKTADLE